MLALLTNKYVQIVVLSLFLIAAVVMMKRSYDNAIATKATIEMNYKILKKYSEDMEAFKKTTEEINKSLSEIVDDLEAQKGVIKDQAGKAIENIDKATDRDNKSSEVLKEAIRSLQGLGK